MTRLNQVVVSSEILEKSWTNGMDESSSQDHFQKSDDPLYLALYQISRAAHTEQSLDDLYASIHGIVSRLMPAQNFYISLYDPASDIVSFPYWVDQYDSCPKPRQGKRGKTEYVLKSGMPFLEGKENLPKLLKNGNYERLGKKSVDWIGVPLKENGISIGVLAVQSYDQGVRYGKEELNILEFVSDQVAMAIIHKRTEMALRESRENLILITDSMPILMAYINVEGRYIYVNKSYADWFGLQKDEIINKRTLDVLSPEISVQIAPSVETALKGEKSYLEFTIKNKQGKKHSVSSSFIPEFNEQNEVKAYYVMLQDITERKLGEHALLESEERYALAVRGANDGIWDWDLVKNHIYYSPRWKRILGYSDDEIGSHPDEWFKRIHPSEKSRVEEEIAAYFNRMSPHMEIEHRILHKDGSYRWVLFRGLSVSDANKRVYRIAGSMSDYTSKKAVEEKLRHDAMHDPLTNLPNRKYFMDQLRLSINRTKRNRRHLAAILFMDLDRFKIVNDSLGHSAGDKMLIEISQRLQLCVRPSDTVARFGGDEFAILLDSINAISDAIHIAERIQQKLQDPFNLFGHEVFSSASIGIVLTNISTGSVEDLLRDADAAMYRAKTSGRSRYEIFDANMHSQNLATLQLESDLRRALDNGEFQILYQPIISLSDKHTTTIEAFLRWDHPERGVIPPEEFLNMADETGVIISMGYWILEEACIHLKALQTGGLPELRLALNLTGRQVQDYNLIKTISRILAKYEIAPESLQLEIRENALMPDFDQTLQTLLELNGMGIKISMDDFGTNYSSLSYLRRFPVNTIKIDSSFIHEIGKETGSNDIINAIISMAHILHLNVVAEGVETKSQFDFLSEQGCDQAQGYYFCNIQNQQDVNNLLYNGFTAG